MNSLPASEKKLIQSILKKYFPKAKVYFFGSRFRGDHKAYSDLDLCLDYSAPLELEKLSQMKEEFSQSNLSYQIDISDWHRINKDFQKIILSEHELWSI